MIEGLIRTFADSYNQENYVEHWKRIRGKIVGGIIGGISAIALASMLYTVPADSTGVVKRFGKYVRISEPGIHLLNAPLGIEKVIKVPVKKVQKEEFGFRTLEAGINSRFLGSDDILSGKVTKEDLEKLVEDARLTPEGDDKALKEQALGVLRNEYLMLTGDLNMADVEWIVQYQIKDPVAYLFNVRDQKELIKDASQAVIRMIIGNGSVDEAITVGRIENENAARVDLQNLLDAYKSGIHVVTVKLQSSNPPFNVRAAFNQVNEAMQKKEQRINEAMQEYNREVPKARGEAARDTVIARGYAIKRVNQAVGDVDKFTMVLDEYRKAPDITRRRLYFETMTEVLPKMSDKTIVDDEGLKSGFYRMLDLKGGMK